MKTLLVAIALLTGIGTSAMAVEDSIQPSTKLLSQSNIEELGLSEGVQESEEWSASSCSAIHQCRNGRVIGCTANGIVTNCQRGGGIVVCRAWGANGSYAQAVDRCR